MALSLLSLATVPSRAQDSLPPRRADSPVIGPAARKASGDSQLRVQQRPDTLRRDSPKAQVVLPAAPRDSTPPPRKGRAAAAGPSPRHNQNPKPAGAGLPDAGTGPEGAAPDRAAAMPRQRPSLAGYPAEDYRGFVRHLFTQNSLFAHAERPIPDVSPPMPDHSQDALFYIILSVFFLLALIRLLFAKYLADLFRAFLNPTLSQRQLKDQLSQTPLPAWIMNCFFALSAGLFLFLVLRRSHYIESGRPYYLIPVFVLLVGLLYLLKYALLRFCGWLSGYQELMNGYIFTLYLINKIAGVALLPFILILAFSDEAIAGIALEVALFVIAALFTYRYIRAYAIVRHQIFFSRFHFFVYLCGFEIVPVLMIGKVVLIWLNGA